MSNKYVKVPLFVTEEGWRLIASVGDAAIHVELHKDGNGIFPIDSIILLTGIPFVFVEYLTKRPFFGGLEAKTLHAAHSLVRKHRKPEGTADDVLAKRIAERASR